MSQSRLWFITTVVVLFAQLSGSAAFEQAQQLPEGLQHVPRDAMAFVHVRLDELLAAPLSKQIRQNIRGNEIIQLVQDKLGIKDADIESVTMVVLPMAELEPFQRLERNFPMQPPAPVVICTMKKAYDRAKLLRGIADGGFGADFSMMGLSERSFLLGSLEGMSSYADLVAHPKGQSNRLQPALELAGKKHLLTAGGYLPAHVKARLFSVSPNVYPSSPGSMDRRTLGMVAPLMNVRLAALTLDVEGALKINVHLHGTNEQSAALALESAKTVLDYLKGAASDAFVSGEALGKVLSSAKFDQQGAVVQLSWEAGPEALQSMFVTLAQGTLRQQSANNLKQITLAMHSYHDTYQGMPPQSINDAEGKPLLSWRVAILPFVEELSLYREFDLSLPWDHPHNKKLIDKMPKIYAAPSLGQGQSGLTYYQVFSGKGMPLDVQGRKNISKGFPGTSKNFLQITDGTSNTILAAEAAEPVIWTKPDDLVYDAKQPLPKLGGVFKNGFHVALIDGSVFFKRNTLSEKTLRLAIEPNDGNVIPSEWYDDLGVNGGLRRPHVDHPDVEKKPEEAPFKEAKTPERFEAPAKIIFQKDEKLTANDPRDPVRQAPCKSYEINLQAGTEYIIDLRSREFDPYLRLEYAGNELTSNDDGGGGLNSRIVFRPTQTGAHRIIATSFSGTGQFSLTVGVR